MKAAGIADGRLPLEPLARFLREHVDQLVATWAQRASTRVPSASELPALNLVDHMPEILSRLAEAVERADVKGVALEDAPHQHAARRLREGYDLREVVVEYQVLRRVIEEGFLALPGDPGARSLGVSFMVLHDALDRAVNEALEEYLSAGSSRARPA